MFEEIKSLDFSGEMKTNELYYLYKTNSSQINLEILSKLQKFKALSDFFKYYMKKDLKIINDAYDNFIHILSTFSNPINKTKFESTIDQYISDFSYIYTLFNIVIKLNDSLTSIISNIKKNLSSIYSKYHIDKIKQEKIDECISCLLDISQHKNNSNKFFSKNSTKDNSYGGSFDNNLTADESKEFFYSSSKQQVRIINDLLNRESNNINLNLVSNTPKFNNIDISPSPSNKKDNNNKNNEEQDKELYLNAYQGSVDSEFTLSANKKKEKYNEKENENVLNTSNNKGSVDINDYITNISPSNFRIKHPRRRTTCVRHFKSNLNLGVNGYDSTDGVNIKTLHSSNKNNNSHDKMLKGLAKDNSYKKLHVSSGHLFMKEESKMYTELLELIIELYNLNKINFEQKLKLKKLIICKSPKILNVYKSFNKDDEIFVQNLIELI
jgi:hypothetical protein